jgi:ParB/RepB/Spo0J family partition protein
MPTTTVPTEQLIQLRHDQLIPAADNVRETIGDIAELAASIEAVGLLQPLRIIYPEGAKKAQILAGARRHAAIGKLIADGKWAKRQTISCVHDGTERSDPDRIAAMLVENLQRQDLNPIEEARGYQRLITEFGYSRPRVQAATGRSKTAVQVRLALLKLSPEVQAAVASKTLPLDIASRLAALPADEQETLVARYGISGLQLHRITEAEARIARQDLTNRFVRLATERGLQVAKAEVWQLTKTHSCAINGLAVKDLGDVLLPDNLTDAFARLDAYRETVDIWLPRPDVPVDDALDTWQRECDRIRDEHRKSVAEWKDRRAAVAAEWAAKAPAKAVHDAAMRALFDDVDVIKDAVRLGLDGEKLPAELEDAFEVWVAQPSNLLRLAALLIVETGWYSFDLNTMFSTHVASELGDWPAHPELPPRPGSAAFTDQPSTDIEHGESDPTDDVPDDTTADTTADTADSIEDVTG